WDQEWVRPSVQYSGGEGMGVYSADLQPGMKRDRTDLPEIALAYVKSIESMRSQGRKGLRVQYAMNMRQIEPQTKAILCRLQRKVVIRNLEGVSTVIDKVRQCCAEHEAEQNTPLFQVRTREAIPIQVRRISSTHRLANPPTTTDRWRHRELIDSS